MNIPAFAVCGWSGSGKTTLIERVIPHLIARSLRIAVLKHTHHSLSIDTPGKDSDRFFRAGADVFLEDPAQRFSRAHWTEGAQRLSGAFSPYDLVLVEGHKTSDFPKVWLLKPGDMGPPEQTTNVLAVLPRGVDRVDAFLKVLQEWLPEAWLKTEIWGCVNTPEGLRCTAESEHLVTNTGQTRLTEKIMVMSQVTTGIAVMGGEHIQEKACPTVAAPVVYLPATPGVRGPMGSLLSAMRWGPDFSWLITTPDLPDMRVETIEWLLSHRFPGLWAILPKRGRGTGVESLFGYFDFRCRLLLEDLVSRGEFLPDGIARYSKAISPVIPEELVSGRFKPVAAESSD